MDSSKNLMFLAILALVHNLLCYDFDMVDAQRVVNVDDFGAKGDGVTLDNKSFEKGWNDTCSSTEQSTTVFLVPEGKTYLLKPIKFDGPCKSNVIFQINGRLEAPSDRSYWKSGNKRIWIEFNRLKHFVVNGGGEVYGNGQVWWEHSCKRNTTLPCVSAPTSLTFNSCQDLLVENINIKDSQQMHLVVASSVRVQISNVSIIAPGKSPNTDGIHITRSQYVNIQDSHIATGDDCVSIVSGSENIQVDNVYCGPGHGISIGSLGKGRSKVYVDKISVTNIFLNGTTNGARIKTWQGGKGIAKRITFQNLTMHNVSNPMIVDQNYCDQKAECAKEHDAVIIKDVLFDNIKGTSAIGMPVTFNCSENNSCQRIMVKDVDLIGFDGSETKSLCSNVELIKLGNIHPPLCE